jgi:hypothetical protein
MRLLAFQREFFSPLEILEEVNGGSILFCLVQVG